MKKRLIIGLALLLAISTVTSYIIINHSNINYDYLASQEMYPDINAVRYSKIGFDDLQTILKKAYFEDESEAGFSSFLLINEEGINDMPWRTAFPAYALAKEYCSSNEDISRLLKEKRYSGTASVDSNTSPQQLFLFLKFAEYAELEIDSDLIAHILEDHYDPETNLYFYSNAQDEKTPLRQFPATYYALLSYEMIGFDTPHLGKIVDTVSGFSFGYQSVEEPDPSVSVMLLDKLGIINAQYEHYAFLKDIILEKDQYLLNRLTANNNTAIQDQSLFIELDFLLSAETILKMDIEKWNNVLRAADFSQAMRAALNSIECLLSSVNISKTLGNPSLFYGKIKNDVLNYVIDAFENGYISYERVSKTNLMDMYFGISLANYCNLSYNTEKINNTINALLETAKSTDSNRELFIYFGLLSKKAIGKDITTRQKKDYIVICNSVLDSMSEQIKSKSDSDQIASYLEELLFVAEIKQLCNSDLQPNDEEVIRSVLNKAIESGITEQSSFFSEYCLLADMIGEKRLCPDINIITETLSYNGGLASSAENREDSTTIISTAKSLRIPEVYSYIDCEKTIEFLNNHVIDSKLRINIEEPGADLRTYYYFFAILSRISDLNDD